MLTTRTAFPSKSSGTIGFPSTIVSNLSADPSAMAGPVSFAPAPPGASEELKHRRVGAAAAAFAAGATAAAGRRADGSPSGVHKRLLLVPPRPTRRPACSLYDADAATPTAAVAAAERGRRVEGEEAAAADKAAFRSGRPSKARRRRTPDPAGVAMSLWFGLFPFFFPRCVGQLLSASGCYFASTSPQRPPEYHLIEGREGKGRECAGRGVAGLSMEWHDDQRLRRAMRGVDKFKPPGATALRWPSVQQPTATTIHATTSLHGKISHVFPKRPRLASFQARELHLTACAEVQRCNIVGWTCLCTW